jgi:hypothetical protein
MYRPKSSEFTSTVIARYYAKKPDKSLYLIFKKEKSLRWTQYYLKDPLFKKEWEYQSHYGFRNEKIHCLLFVFVQSELGIKSRWVLKHLMVFFLISCFLVIVRLLHRPTFIQVTWWETRVVWIIGILNTSLGSKELVWMMLPPLIFFFILTVMFSS